jgi:phosphatidylserine/phosphatidylglycerophosphate/cardiolipin synthase-like enzyme
VGGDVLNDVIASVYVAIPEKASSEGSDVGSNPRVYYGIEQELKARESDIKEIHLALYLFNNPKLYQTIRGLAKSRQISIVVISTPLAAYDEGKIESARQIYYDIAKSCKTPGTHGNLVFLIYPHMYIWYGAEYAEAKASYSFHVKAGYILYKNGSCKFILTSCNMSPGDPYHSESAVVLEDPSCSSPFSYAFKKFFQELETLAVPWCKYESLIGTLPRELQIVADFAFIGKHGLKNWVEEFTDTAFFTGPFIKIREKGSTHFAREKIVETIMGAEKRILVCGQHVHDIAPFNGYAGPTLIGALAEKKRDNPNLDVRVLKQVSSSGLADKRRAAFVECHLDYAGIKQRVNKLVHDKFIVVDDKIIVSTANFTTTQFGWGERAMELVVEQDINYARVVVNSALQLYGHPQSLVRLNPVIARKAKSQKTKVVKQDIFAEVNAFVVVESAELAEKFARYFDNLWKHPLSRDVEILR